MAKLTNLHVQVVHFRRNEKSNYEQGIMINHDKIIIDKEGKIVPFPVYNYRYYPEQGTLNLFLK